LEAIIAFKKKENKMPKTREHSKSNPQSSKTPASGTTDKSQISPEKEKKKSGQEGWAPEKPITKNK